MVTIIREALPVDIPDVVALTVEAYREYSQYLTSDNWAMMQTSLSRVAEIAKPGKLLVVEADAQLVGSVVYHPPGASDARLFPSDWPSMRLLAVSPLYRGQGIGRQLSQACIDRAKQDQAAVLSLHTSEIMATAKNMYDRLGFKLDIELPSYFGIQYWRYVLKLRAAASGK
jgi:ribosomal protein S18 acetylase RimI-like enzyme